MSTLELKDQVIERLKDADEHLLKKIQATIDDYQEDKIVAYTVSGKPLTIKEYRNEVENAVNEAKEGKYFTTEQLKKEIESWKKSFGQK
jgi:inorganic pyrophosphatase